MALRLAFFYACGQFSGTISGLLAYAISFMNGVGGLSGWRWVFILEGIPALLCGAYTFFFLPDYPDDTTKFLSQEEKDIIVDFLPKTQPHAKAKTWDIEQVKVLFKDPTFITFNLIWISHAIGGWGVSKVLPTVVYDLGMEGSAVSQLMTMPTYAFGCSCLVLIGWLIQTKKLTSWIAAICREYTRPDTLVQYSDTQHSGSHSLGVLYHPHHGPDTNCEVYLRLYCTCMRHLRLSSDLA